MKNIFLSLLLIPFIISGCTGKSGSDRVGGENPIKSGTKISGYKEIGREVVESIGSEVVKLKHEKSGASVVLIMNGDPALSFMAGFRTPPYDDTGLFHIFEHAVLEGSRLYPSKSNFFHLANSSVASFINAMTGPVFTLYPFVTRSPKDFDNLMSVYMDAVFFPNVLQDPRIIQREGWRYELTPDKKSLAINGIVLSEMKGAFASPYRSLWFNLSRALIPNTPFSYESGGLPEKVATLTFEQIKEAHKKYYHPQNSVIYLYGDVDYAKTLKTIDQQFLSEFSKTDDYQPPKIDIQKNFNYPTPVVQASYPGSDGPSKDFVAKGFILGPELTQTEENAASVLIQAFVENDAAPLKLRVLKEGLAKSSFSASIGGRDNGMAFVFEGSESKNREALEKVITEEVEKIVKNGMDEQLLNSILNKYEFSYKEKNSNGSHKGMQLGSIVLGNWLYNLRPLEEDLDFVSQFKKLRKLLADKQYVKDFFKRYIQENDKVRWVVLQPDKNFSQKFNAGLDEQIKNALKEKGLDKFAQEDAVFKEWVAMKESPEILKKTPTLELADIKADEKPIEVQKKKGDYETLIYPQETSGISYINLFFDLQGVSQEDLKNLELFTGFIDRTDTKNYKFDNLSKEIDTWLGGLSFSVSVYQSAKDPEKFKPALVVSLRYIDDNREKSMGLVKELLTENTFSPVERMNNLMDELKTGMVSGVSGRAPSLSMMAAIKNFYPAQGAFNEETSGGVFENYILNSEIEIEPLIQSLNRISDRVFDQKRLFLTAITASPNQIKNVEKDIKKLHSALPSNGQVDQKWSFENQADYDGYIIPGEVQYVSLATSFRGKIDYSGTMAVYSLYLNNNYMTPKLREQAGAYGGSASFSRNGLFSMSTYKDPNLKKSLEIFSGAVDFMKNETLDAETLKPAILGSLKSYYRDKSIYAKTSFMTYLHLTDRTWEDYMQIKKEILATTPEKIQKISSVLEEVMKEAKTGVAGNASKVKAEAEFLKNILTLR